MKTQERDNGTRRRPDHKKKDIQRHSILNEGLTVSVYKTNTHQYPGNCSQIQQDQPAPDPNTHNQGRTIRNRAPKKRTPQGEEHNRQREGREIGRSPLIISIKKRAQQTRHNTTTNNTPNNTHNTTKNNTPNHSDNKAGNQQLFYRVVCPKY